MKRPRLALTLAVASCLVCAAVWSVSSLRGARFRATSAVLGKQPDGTYLVPTGQTIKPAGESFVFDGRPVDLALSPDGKTLAVMMPTGIRLFDTVHNRFFAEEIIGAHGFGGLVWSGDGHTLYSAGSVRQGGRGSAAHGAVLVTEMDGSGHATERKPILFGIESRISPNTHAKESDPSGLAISADGKTLFVSLFNNATVAVVDLSSYDPATGAATTAEVSVGSSPEKLVLSLSGEKLYVANRGGRAPQAGDTVDNDDPVVVDPDTYRASSGTVSVLDTAKLRADPQHAVAKSIAVGLQPADLAFSRDGRFLYTANANSDSVSVISTASDTVLETIAASPAPERLAESSPNGLVASPDGRSLYVTLGGDNCVEVIALDKAAGGAEPVSRIVGLIPTAWFPLGVALDRDGKRLFVMNSKGIGSRGEMVAKPRLQNAAMPEAGPGGVLTGGDVRGHSVYAVMGSIGVVPAPDARTLGRMTAEVAHLDHFDRMKAALDQPADPFWSRFKHAILIIKENRTYDQVLGDVPLPPGHVGGDPRLVMFGENITPNHHALARQFGLLDNLYCTGAISADGHHWLNEAFASDYAERAMNTYPRSYPCCGSDPLVFAGNPFLWQAALAAGRTFRDYGEFGPLPSMRKHADNQYDRFIPVTADSNRDVAHADRIVADIKAAEADSSKPGLADLTFIWLPNNHTSGTTPGAFTPESCLADNDLALGRVVDAISHSKRYWHDEPTAIFVVEDDAQGGLDHVDGHRTIGFVISPYNRRGQIVDVNYNQLNMVRTIELILGIKPLNQFDAASLAMRECFQDQPDYTAYDVQKNRIALNLRNPPLRTTSGNVRHWEAVSAMLDFSAPDRADPEQVTEILWHHTHGDAAYPPADAALW